MIKIGGEKNLEASSNTVCIGALDVDPYMHSTKLCVSVGVCVCRCVLNVPIRLQNLKGQKNKPN